MIPRHDARVPHVLGEEVPCTLLVRYPRDPHGEREVVGVLISGERGPALLVDYADALTLDGQPDAELRIDRSIRQHEHDDATTWTPWAAVAL